jgi:hypothetical protein
VHVLSAKCGCSAGAGCRGFFIINIEHCGFEFIAHYSLLGLIFLMETIMVFLSLEKQVLGWYLRPQPFPSTSFHIYH